MPQPLIDPDATARPSFVLSERYDSLDAPWHSHRRAQLIHASEGVLSVHTPGGLWVVPPQRAVWVLPGIPHRIVSRRSFWLRTLYVEAELLALPAECCVIAIDRLVDELLIAAADFGTDYPESGPEQRLIQVILDRLPRQALVPVHLPQPRDPRLLRVTGPLLADPADPRTLEDLTADAGVTSRTAARLFLKETGLTFGQWRQQARLLAAIERLGVGGRVTQVALEVGYADVSSFIAAFKSAFGTTPARYFR